MKFEFYVPNYDWNKQKIYMFNIFDNHYIQEWSEKAVKKYLRAPSKYCYIHYGTSYSKDLEKYVSNNEYTYGFDGLVKEINSILMHELSYRREYETNISDAFTYEIRDIVYDLDRYTDLDELKDELKKIERKNPKLEKWDCYGYCKQNIEIITHEIIRQYKEQFKKNNNTTKRF